MKHLSKRIIKKCEEKLKETRDRYLTTMNRKRDSFEMGSEIIDKATYEQQIQSSNYFRSKIDSLLPEINRALNRIKEGTYGVCEITGEYIEEKRLLAVPWTRVSLQALHSESA